MAREPVELTERRRALGRRLATFRRAARLTQAELAHRLHYQRASLSNIENGHQPSPRQFWERADTALAAGGILLRDYDELAAAKQAHHEAIGQRPDDGQDAPPATWRTPSMCPDPRPNGSQLVVACDLESDEWTKGNSQEFSDLIDADSELVAADTVMRLVHQWLVMEPPQVAEVTGGRRIGEGLVSRVEHRVAQLRRMDDFVAGRDLHDLVERELKATARLLREAAYDESVGRRLLVAVGELCQLAGWVDDDAGLYSRATHYYGLGIKAAHAANDVQLAANLISTLSYQVSNVADARDAVLLARTAEAGARNVATLTTRALLMERVAWAHARAGERRQTERALSTVENHYERRRPDDDPEWVYWLNEGEVKVMAGRCWVELGMPERAVPLLSGALRNYSDDMTREVALYTSWLAEAHIMLGNVDAAVAQAMRALELTVGIASTRSDERIDVLRRRFRQYTDVAVVRDFEEHARALGVTR